MYKEYKDIIMNAVNKFSGVTCVAMFKDKILFGVQAGTDTAVMRFLSEELKDVDVDYAVGWEVRILQYPIVLVRDREWIGG